MTLTDIQNMFAGAGDAAYAIGFFQGWIVAKDILTDPDADEPPVTMGDYERRHLGPRDFDELDILMFPRELAEQEGLPYSVIEMAEDNLDDEVWSAYVNGYNAGVLAVYPKALEAGEE
jgi:hypothetical protein